jgi:hypothetical protein
VLRFQLLPRTGDRRAAVERYRIIQPSLDWTVRLQSQEPLALALEP